MVVLGQKFLYSGDVVVFGQYICIRARVVVFGQKWLYSGNSKRTGYIRAKWLYSGKKWVYSDKVVVFGQSGFIRAKVDVKEAVFGKSCCILANVVVVGQKWLYSCKSGCIRAK